MREPKVTVKIPRPLYRKIQQVVDGSGFSSPTDFIVFVLRDLMGDSPAAKVDPEVGLVRENDGKEFTQAELDDVRRKLENLGYL
ncbi:MAG: Arc/MetJ-type ribon-helix-helix transcriptional regulator [Paracoccaceae bacterium]